MGRAAVVLHFPDRNKTAWDRMTPGERKAFRRGYIVRHELDYRPGWVSWDERLGQFLRPIAEKLLTLAIGAAGALAAFVLVHVFSQP